MPTVYVKKGRGKPRELRTLVIVEEMPDSRVRLSPMAVPDLVCWIDALRARWDKVARMTLSGYKGKERERRKAQILAAKARCAVYDEVAQSMHETIANEAYQAARHQWQEGLSTAAKE